MRIDMGAVKETLVKKGHHFGPFSDGRDDWGGIVGQLTGREYTVVEYVCEVHFYQCSENGDSVLFLVKHDGCVVSRIMSHPTNENGRGRFTIIGLKEEENGEVEVEFSVLVWPEVDLPWYKANEKREHYKLRFDEKGQVIN